MKIADLIVSLSADVAQFRTSMDNASESVNKLTEVFKKAEEAALEFLAAREIINFVKEAASATEEWAFSLQKLSSLTGLSSESAATFTAVAREEGVSTDVVTTALGRLSLALASHPQKFQQLGIAVRDAQGQLLPMQQILANTVKGLDEFKTGADRDAAAATILGKGFANLLPDLQRLAPALAGEEWEKARQLIEGLGLAIDANGIAKAREWEKAQADLSLVFLGFENQIGKALLPVITQLADKISDYARDGSLKRWADEAAQAFLSLALGVVHLGEILIENRTVVELALEGFGAMNIAQGHLVAGTTELASGVALATGNYTKLYEGLKKTEGAILSAKGTIAGAPQDVFPATTITGGDGDKHFTPPPTAAAESAAEKFQKLTTELTAQRAEQDALSEAWKRGGVEAQGITDRFDAFKASLALGKENTDAQRAAIDKLSLSVKNAAEQAKLNEQVSKFSATATNQVQFQKDLSAAYAAGGTAVESITAKEKAHQAVLALGLNATEAAKKAVNDLSLAESKATDDAKRVETLAKSAELLQENTAYQGRLTEAYREGGRAVLAIEDSEKAYQAVLALGKNATAEQIAQVTQLSLANSAATRLTAQAQTANQDLIGSLKEAGGAFETAFTGALKPGSDMLALLKSLGEQLEDIVLKATIFKPLERELDAFLNGTGGSAGTSGGTGIFGAIGKLISGASPAKPTAPAIGGTPEAPDFTALITNGFEDSGSAITNSLGSAWDNLGQGTHISDALAKVWDTLGSGTHISDAFSKAFHAIGGGISSLFGGGADAPGGSGGVAGPPPPTVSQSGLGTSIAQFFAPVLSLFGINIASQTTATVAQTAATTATTSASVTLTTAAAALTASAATLTAAAAALTASAGGSAASSGLGGLFGSGLDGLGNSAGSGAGAAASSSVSSTNLGNPVSSSSFRPPDVRGSAASAAPTVNIHGVANPEKATVNHKQKATGGYDIEVYLADSVAKNIRSGGKIAQAQRDTFGNNRVAIQR